MGRHQREGTERTYAVKQMWDVHHEIVRRALTGMKHVDIARSLGISPVTVSYTLCSPMVKRQLDVLRSVRDLQAIDVAKKITELAPKAVEVMEELMDNESANVRLKAAEGILDRAGHAPVQRMKVDGSVSHYLSTEELDDIKARAKDIGLVVDAEYVPQLCEARA